MSCYDLDMKIDQLKREMYEGEIPTWYACQEIDRLEAMKELLRRTK